MSITIVGPKESPKAPKGDYPWFVNTTSRSTSPLGKQFSPFFLGPVPLYEGAPAGEALNVENAWQFSKVYKKHTDESGDPSTAWIAWARKGFRNSKAFRYPMGKGAKPEYAYWEGDKLLYIEARKRIYIPLYKYGIKTHRKEAFAELCKLYEKERRLMLWDYDGYNRKSLSLSPEEVVDCAEKTMGHAFVIEQLLLEHFGGELES